MAVSRLRIVVYPESPKEWTARSLEHDIAAAGRTAEAAIDSLVRIAEAHIAFDTRHGRRPLSGFAAAPQIYWAAFERAGNQSKPREVHRADARCPLQCVVGQVPQNPVVTRYSRFVRTA